MRKPAAGYARMVMDSTGQQRFVDYNLILLPGDRAVDVDGEEFQVTTQHRQAANCWPEAMP